MQDGELTCEEAGNTRWSTGEAALAERAGAPCGGGGISSMGPSVRPSPARPAIPLHAIALTAVVPTGRRCAATHASVCPAIPVVIVTT